MDSVNELNQYIYSGSAKYEYEIYIDGIKEELTIVNYTLNGSDSNIAVQFGNIHSQYINITLDGRLLDAGKQIFIRLLPEGFNDYINVGAFYIQGEPTVNGTYYTYTAYDKSIYFDVPTDFIDISKPEPVPDEQGNYDVSSYIDLANALSLSAINLGVKLSIPNDEYWTRAMSVKMENCRLYMKRFMGGNFNQDYTINDIKQMTVLTLLKSIAFISGTNMRVEAKLDEGKVVETLAVKTSYSETLRNTDESEYCIDYDDCLYSVGDNILSNEIGFPSKATVKLSTYQVVANEETGEITYNESEDNNILGNSQSGSSIDIEFPFKIKKDSIEFEKFKNIISKVVIDRSNEGKSKFVRYSFSIIGDPRLRSGMYVNIGKYKCYIGTLSYTYDGGIKAEIGSGSVESNNTVTMSGTTLASIAAAVKNLKIDTTSMSYNNLTVGQFYAKTAEFGFVKADELQAKVANIETLNVDSAFIKYLKSNVVDADTIKATVANIETLNADSAFVKYLKSNIVDADTIQTAVANIKTLNADSAFVKYLKSNIVDADTIKAAVAELDYLTTEQADIKYADIDFSNIEKSVIGTMLASIGLISSATITEGHVTGYLDSVEINANKITAGKLDAGNIEVVNLNCANLTVGTINGTQIAGGAIDVTKLDSVLQTRLADSEEDVAKAVADAKSAILSASGANENASSALTKANSASTTANSASTTASNAVTAANTASSTASSAVTTANSAKSAATTASTNASNAVSTANSASTTANSALNNSNRGLKKWLISQYSTTSNYYTIDGIIGSKLAPICTYEYNDASLNISSMGQNLADQYSAYAKTYILFTADTSLATTVTTDDAGALYVNGSLITETVSCANTSVTIPFKKGWNVIEVTYHEGAGGDGFKFGTTLSSHANCSRMDCYANANTDDYFTKANSISKWCKDNNVTYIDGGKLYTGTVVANAIAANAIIADKIATDAVTAIKIQAGAISTDKLAANAVTAGKIAASTITAGCIASNAITTDKINASAITAAKIATDAVTADKIIAGAVTATKIASSAITTDKLSANAVTAAKIASSAITTDKLSANAVTAAKINVTDLFSKNITASNFNITGGSINVTTTGKDVAFINVNYLQSNIANFKTLIYPTRIKSRIENLKSDGTVGTTGETDINGSTITSTNTNGTATIINGGEISANASITSPKYYVNNTSYYLTNSWSKLNGLYLATSGSVASGNTAAVTGGTVYNYINNNLLTSGTVTKSLSTSSNVTTTCYKFGRIVMYSTAFCASATKTGGNTLFTLPSGFRPMQKIFFAIEKSGTGIALNGTLDTSGNIYCSNNDISNGQWYQFTVIFIIS